MSESRKAWTEEEDHAIRTLVRKHGTHRWSEISKRMMDHFGPPGRSGKQCRERWHNHLNPKINKSPWSEEEEKILFRTHQEHGNRWKKIADELPGRTDNDIKNKFYSTMRKKLRKINKLLGKKNSTSEVKEIKPKVLSNILSLEQEQNEELKEIWKELSYLLFQFDERKTKSLPHQEKERFIEIINRINELNSEYIGDKAIKIVGEVVQEESLNRHPLTRKRSSLLKSQQLKKRSSVLSRRSKISKKKTSPTEAPNNITVTKPKQTKKTEDHNHVSHHSEFNFSLGFDEEVDFKSHYHPTPTISRRFSYGTPGQQLSFNLMPSPMNLRGFYRTPVGPTPFSMGTPNIGNKPNDLANPETYNNTLFELQGQVQKNLKRFR